MAKRKLEQSNSTSSESTKESKASSTNHTTEQMGVNNQATNNTFMAEVSSEAMPSPLGGAHPKLDCSKAIETVMGDSLPNKQQRRGKSQHNLDKSCRAKKLQRVIRSLLPVGVSPHWTISVPVVGLLNVPLCFNYNPMEAIFWNVRGTKGHVKQMDIKNFLHSHKPEFVSLLETKLDENSFKALKRKIGLYPNSHLGPDARICLLWNEDIMDVQVLDTSFSTPTAIFILRYPIIRCLSLLFMLPISVQTG
ncbi:hypothetical protein QJS10_CPA02g00870 [Acorus calamus]|uniref:Uncharacterized protein n=1 Tax=Acorus calamus TaxID=4465 RepID=A0AAV9FDK7_ACOCL|nr:hypothetical protein QJS10_CPA02g00870 [Acorus calamus]